MGFGRLAYRNDAGYPCRFSVPEFSSVSHSLLRSEQQLLEGLATFAKRGSAARQCLAKKVPLTSLLTDIEKARQSPARREFGRGRVVML
jgi:hypothetical protein